MTGPAIEARACFYLHDAPGLDDPPFEFASPAPALAKPSADVNILVVRAQLINLLTTPAPVVC
jgi:hypothetical protein